MRRTNRGKREKGKWDVKVEFDSLSEAMAYADREVEEDPDNDKWKPSSRKQSKDGWAGAETWEESKDRAVSGWKEGLDKIRETQAGVEENLPGTPKKKFQPTNSLSGGSVDIGRYLQGEPDCFRSVKKQKTGQRQVDIAFNCTVSGGVDTDTIFKRGAAIVKLIEKLEKSGASVRLTMVTHNTKGGEWQAEITVKEPKQRLELEKLAWCLCSPGFFRRLIFALEEAEDKDFREDFSVYRYGGYGTVGKNPDLKEEADLYFDGAGLYDEDVDWNDSDSVADWIQGHLEDQGVKMVA